MYTAQSIEQRQLSTTGMLVTVPLAGRDGCRAEGTDSDQILPHADQIRQDAGDHELAMVLHAERIITDSFLAAIRPDGFVASCFRLVPRRPTTTAAQSCASPRHFQQTMSRIFHFLIHCLHTGSCGFPISNAYRYTLDFLAITIRTLPPPLYTLRVYNRTYSNPSSKSGKSLYFEKE